MPAADSASEHAAPEHAVAIVGGAVAGSEAARVLAERGVLAVVLEQKDRPYGKIEDGLPRWHREQRAKQRRAIDDRLTRPRVLFVPRVRLGGELSVADLLSPAWGFEAVLLATGAWRDRPLPIEGIERFLGRGLVYQNPFVAAWNRLEDRPGPDPDCPIEDGAVVVGGGLASIDVVKILQLELVRGALAARGLASDLVDLEHDGIPRTLARHALDWPSLGLRGALLIYRRRAEDMPLAWAAPGSGEDGLARARAVRAKIIERALDKYCFRFAPCRVPVAAIADGDRLAGLVVARTETPEGRGGSPRAVPGSEEELRAPCVIGSIGSTPEPLPGLPMQGELFRMKDGATGELEGFEGVYALGNVVTGQGNIQASLKHATAVAHHVVARYLGVGDAVLPDGPAAHDVDPLLALASRRACSRAEAVLERLEARPPLPAERIASILARVRALQARCGYTDYASWVGREPGA